MVNMGISKYKMKGNLRSADRSVKGRKKADQFEDETVANDSTCNSTINENTYSNPTQQSTPLHPNYSVDTNDYNGSVARDGTPVISGVTGDYFRPSDVYQTVSLDYTNTVGDSYTTSTSRRRRERRVLSEAPTAKASAFSGPPRYDWIDIVSFVICLRPSCSNFQQTKF